MSKASHNKNLIPELFQVLYLLPFVFFFYKPLLSLIIKPETIALLYTSSASQDTAVQAY